LNTTCLSDLEVLPKPLPKEGITDLRVNPVVSLSDYVLDDVLGAKGLNDIINKLTSNAGNFFVKSIEGFFSVGGLTYGRYLVSRRRRLRHKDTRDQ
jgi:hypothetical protein